MISNSVEFSADNPLFDVFPRRPDTDSFPQDNLSRLRSRVPWGTSPFFRTVTHGQATRFPFQRW